MKILNGREIFVFIVFVGLAIYILLCLKHRKNDERKPHRYYSNFFRSKMRPRVKIITALDLIAYCFGISTWDEIWLFFPAFVASQWPNKIVSKRMLEEAMERGSKIHNFVIDSIFFSLSFFIRITRCMRRELAVGKNLSIKKVSFEKKKSEFRLCETCDRVKEIKGVKSNCCGIFEVRFYLRHPARNNVAHWKVLLTCKTVKRSPVFVVMCSWLPVTVVNSVKFS